jgi:DNA-binding NarL/FixJ family response regulator
MELRVHPYARAFDGKSRPFVGGAALDQVQDDHLPDLPGKSHQRDKSLLILDKRALDRECITQSIQARDSGLDVQAFSTTLEWKNEEKRHPPLCVVLLSIGGRKVGDPETLSELAEVTAQFPKVPVVVLGDSDELEQILLALEKGARGYIPTTFGISVCIEAISLAIAGGTFVPASSVLSNRMALGEQSQTPRPMAGLFTQRQEEVARALRRGKANKIIAYELNMRESTVKVHIRNIMKKLKATNRTEVAFKINEILAGEERH